MLYPIELDMTIKTIYKSSYRVYNHHQLLQKEMNPRNKGILQIFYQICLKSQLIYVSNIYLFNKNIPLPPH